MKVIDGTQLPKISEHVEHVGLDVEVSSDDTGLLHPEHTRLRTIQIAVPGDETYVGHAGRSLKWRIRKDQDGFVDFDSIFRGIDWAVAYALTNVRAPSDMSVILGIGSDDGIKVWLNRQLVHSKLAERSAIPGDDVVSAQRGVRRVLLEGRLDHAIGARADHEDRAFQLAPLRDQPAAGLQEADINHVPVTPGVCLGQ